jgi:hypothetical protein
MVGLKRCVATRVFVNDGHTVAAARRCVFIRYCTPWTLSRSPLALGNSTAPWPRDLALGFGYNEDARTPSRIGRTRAQGWGGEAMR